MFLASSAGVLWRAAEAAEIADAMIEAHRDILRKVILIPDSLNL
jgi:hypothetical protein